MSEAKQLVVPRGEVGQRAPTLAAVVRELCDLPWSKARVLCERGKVTVNGDVCVDAATRVSPGATVDVNPVGNRVRSTELDRSAIVHLDNDVVVVRKPVGVMTVPYEEGDKDTLVDRVRLALKRKTGRGNELGVVQRLDKDTTGILVFARNLAAKRHLQQQFRVHSIERQYVALVHGHCRRADMDTQLLRNRGDGLRGSYGHFRKPKGPVPADSQRAVTEVRLERGFADASLIRCRLHTGRQHQIRIHVSEMGHPLIGERVYIRDFQGTQISAPRPMLHATVLEFEHPRSGAKMSFSEPPPADFKKVLAGLKQA